MQKEKEDKSGFFLTDKVKVKTLILEKDHREGLENRRFNITILAEQIGWDRVRVSNVINNQIKNLSAIKFRSIQISIADALGIDLSKIQSQCLFTNLQQSSANKIHCRRFEGQLISASECVPDCNDMCLTCKNRQEGNIKASK